MEHVWWQSACLVAVAGGGITLRGSRGAAAWMIGMGNAVSTSAGVAGVTNAGVGTTLRGAAGAISRMVGKVGTCSTCQGALLVRLLLLLLLVLVWVGKE